MQGFQEFHHLSMKINLNKKNVRRINFYIKAQLRFIN